MISKEALLDIIKREERANSSQMYYYLTPGEMTAALFYGIAKVIKLNDKIALGNFFSEVEINGKKFGATGKPIIINAKYLSEKR